MLCHYILLNKCIFKIRFSFWIFKIWHMYTHIFHLLAGSLNIFLMLSSVTSIWSPKITFIKCIFWKFRFSLIKITVQLFFSLLLFCLFKKKEKRRVIYQTKFHPQRREGGRFFNFISPPDCMARCSTVYDVAIVTLSCSGKG